MNKMLGKCIICGSELSDPLFTVDNMPCGAQAMPDADGLKTDKGIDLKLCRCKNCGLVQFDCEPVDYYRDAIRVVGLSKTMQDLRRADYRHLIEDYGLGKKKWLECGSSNGDFLKVLEEFPVEIYGTENGEENVKVSSAKLDRAHIMKFFPESPDLDIPGAPFDVFLSFNFLEHQPDPVSMLKCIHRNLSEDGIGLITVPSFEYIIKEGRYYELIRDHIANYDLNSLCGLCERCGFKILEKGFIGIGDTLRVVVRKKDFSGNENTIDNLPAALKYDSAVVSDAKVFSENYEKLRSEISNYMDELDLQGRSIALWGAGHQGFTLASTTALKDHAKYILDSSDKKQGRFAPASHLPIAAPEHYYEDPVDVIMIVAPGYVKEIEGSIRDRFGKEPGCCPKICDILNMTER